ncbi:MAG: carboxypeptidase-like regulatory domain-containing protein, partial [Pyrinomonadaceae bacterium]
MKDSALEYLFLFVAVALLMASSISPAFAQSQSQNGQIEGTVSDQNNAAVPNSLITVTNIETGATRTVTTDESGVYRFPLLPLGTYRITAEAASFKKFIREGVTLNTGQTATIDIPLQTGDLNEVVTVSSDTSVADAGRIDLGRVMNTREVQNLPLITSNPYNFAFLQANVTGRPARGFPFTTINANGYLRRANFLLDGNTNTQGDRGTLRFLLLS